MQDEITILRLLILPFKSGRFKFSGTSVTNQIPLQEEIKQQIEVRECLLEFGAEYFVFQFAIQTFKA